MRLTARRWGDVFRVKLLEAGVISWGKWFRGLCFGERGGGGGEGEGLTSADGKGGTLDRFCTIIIMAQFTTFFKRQLTDLNFIPFANVLPSRYPKSPDCHSSTASDLGSIPAFVWIFF